MPVSATSYDAQVSAALVNLVAASATFQGACGVATAALARSFIVEDDGELARAAKCVDGTALDISKVWIAIRGGTVRPVFRALATYGHEGDATGLLVVPKLANETNAEWLRRARNYAGGIRDDISALWGQTVNGAPTMPYGLIEPDAPLIADPTSALAGCAFVHLAISHRDIP